YISSLYYIIYRCNMVRELIELDKDTHDVLQDIAKFFGVKVKDVLEIYVSNLWFIKQIIKDEGEFLKTHLKLRGKGLLDFTFSRVLSLTGFQVLLRRLDEILGIWRKGFTLEYVSWYEKTPYMQGIVLDFAATRLSRTLINDFELTIGIEVDFEEVGPSFYGRGAALHVSSIVGFQEDLGENYNIVKTKLEKSIESLRTDIIGDLETYVLDQCDVGGASIELEEFDGELSIHIDMFVDDITCLPRIDIIDKAIAKIIRRAGLRNLIRG
ncbi:MAG: hypothetical protein QW417_06465, partial [Zestosphaera sp.]